MDSLPGNTKNRESTRLWLMRMRFLSAWADGLSTRYLILAISYWLSDMPCHMRARGTHPVAFLRAHSYGWFKWRRTDDHTLSAVEKAVEKAVEC